MRALMIYIPPISMCSGLKMGSATGPNVGIGDRLLLLVDDEGMGMSGGGAGQLGGLVNADSQPRSDDNDGIVG